MTPIITSGRSRWSHSSSPPWASRVLVGVAALALAADMVGAIIVSGLGRGEDISLTLAPALLVAMIILIRIETPARYRGRHPAPMRGRRRQW